MTAVIAPVAALALLVAPSLIGDPNNDAWTGPLVSGVAWVVIVVFSATAWWLVVALVAAGPLPLRRAIMIGSIVYVLIGIGYGLTTGGGGLGRSGLSNLILGFTWPFFVFWLRVGCPAGLTVCPN